MNKFDDFINSLLTEAKHKRPTRTVTKRSTASRSKANRKKRARAVEITNHKKTQIHGGERTRHEANAESAEKSESTKHTVRIDVVNKTKAFKDMSCSCSDFQSRYKYFRNEDGVSKWGTVEPIKDVFKPHTKQSPDQMNPDNNGYVCKHLLAFQKIVK